MKLDDKIKSALRGMSVKNSSQSKFGTLIKVFQGALGCSDVNFVESVTAAATK